MHDYGPYPAYIYFQFFFQIFVVFVIVSLGQELLAQTDTDKNNLDLY